MANFKFDGTYFIDKSHKRIAKVSGDYIEDCNKGYKRVAKINGDFIEDCTNGYKRVVKINSDYIEDCSNGYKRVAKVDDLKKIIDGYSSKAQLIAFWWFFAR